MKLIINGTEKAIGAREVAGMLLELGLKAEEVVVEVNKEIVTRGEYAEHTLREGDRIEIVTLVGGG